MLQIAPLTIAFKMGEALTVTTLREASEALNRMGLSNDDPEFMHVAYRVAEALNGRSSPRVAFNAFEAAAIRRGMVVKPDLSQEFEARL